jgi:putative tryptophan/tyrosine transport system substrate-binding protein
MIGRREFITLLGGAGAASVSWPVAARAQPAVPTIGFLSALSSAQTVHLVDAFRRGLSQAGFVEGQNIAIDYRFADGQYDRLSAFAADMVRRRVALIATQGPPAAIAAKTATTTIPIVFVVGLDPIAAGLVASFNRPGGNATGITLITGPLGQKRLELLLELLPKASAIAMLVNPLSPDAAPELRDVQAAAKANKLELNLLNASTPGEISTAFAGLKDHRPALLVGSDPFFVNRRDEIVELANSFRIPAIYPFREFPDSGGLMSYGTNIPKVNHDAGIYAGRILKGEKPSNLPVLQPTTFELVVNLKTARAAGIEVPPTLLARADEVIE